MVTRDDLYFPKLAKQKTIVTGKALVGAVAHWGCRQRPGEVAPPHLIAVLTRLNALAKLGPYDVMEFDGPQECQQWISEILRSIPEYEKWNAGDDGDWIDLDALERNVAMQLAQETALL